MGMQTDVKALSLAASGAVTNARVRIRGLVVEPGASTGSVIIKDGGSSGAARLTVNTVASATQPTYLLLPGEGMLFSTNVYVDVTNVGSVMIVYS